MFKKSWKTLIRWVYQQQDGEEAVEDVVPVGQVALPAERKDLHTHFKQVVEDEAQVDDLRGDQGESHPLIAEVWITYALERKSKLWPCDESPAVYL